jgi:hypothetical protein
MYGIISELKVTLEGQSGPKPSAATLASRIESHLKGAVENLSSHDFLKKIEGALQGAGMRKVLSVKINDVAVFSYDGQKGGEAWDGAFEVASKAAAASKGTDEWWILVTGSDGDFKFRQDVTFKQKHSFASPSMQIVIRALPAEWAPKPVEGSGAWASRLRQILRDKEAVKAVEAQAQPRIDAYLQEYQRILKSAFTISDFSRELRIDLSKTDVESFRGNYENEQGP